MSETLTLETVTEPVSEVSIKTKNLYIESYGCAMNFSDSEIVASILQKRGFVVNNDATEADMIFLNTCSIREKAEQKIRTRLKVLNKLKHKKPQLKIGVLGCMAERMKQKLLDEEKIVDIVAGPDSYRSLPSLIDALYVDGKKGINVILSKEETYGDIPPLRFDTNGISAWVTITRGCDNMCSFCVVPFTRGRERSRNPETIINEIAEAKNQGYKEITLLGQNVDSYFWYGGGAKKDFILNRTENTKTVNFAQLLNLVAENFPEIRIRFSTSNPQDMTEEVFHIIKKHTNICNYVHLPIQSGNDETLKKMNRGHNRAEYLAKIKQMREMIPECGITTDIIAGFCGETEEAHQDTLSLMEEVRFDYAYMFKYSERSHTFAAKKFDDDIPETVKSRRLAEIIEHQKYHSMESNKKDKGKIFEVLVEGNSKRSEGKMIGRNSQNKVVVFEAKNIEKGNFVEVQITDCTSATLIGNIIN